MVEEFEVTRMSSRGQIVVPMKLRRELNLKEGSKFIAMGVDDTIVLKKIEAPSFDELIKRTRKFAKVRGIKKGDVERAIRRVRRE